MDTSGEHGRGTAAFGVALALLGTGALALVCGASPARILGIIADGSGYYLQIARNIAHGRGVTFDGLHVTNGFHPLWTWVLIPLMRIPMTSELALRVVGLLVIALLVVASLVFYRTLRRTSSPPAALAGALVFAAAAFLNFCLVEAPLFLALGSLLFAYGISCRMREDYRARSAFATGLLLGVTLLARLDSGFIAVAFGIGDLVLLALHPERRKKIFIRLFWTVVGASVLVLPFLGYNQLAFGHAVPFSGRLESMFPRHRPLTLGSFRAFGTSRAFFLVPGVAYLAILAFGKREGTSPTAAGLRCLRGTAVILVCAAIVHTMHEVLFMKWPLYWHAIMMVPLGGILTALFCDWLGRRRPEWSTRGLVLAVVVPVLAAYAFLSVRRVQGQLANDWRTGAYEAALYLREHTPEGTLAAMRVAEITGFFAERQTVDILGLCGNFQLQEAIREQRVRAYLESKGVTYLVVMDYPERFEAAGSPEDVAEGRYERGAFRIDSELYYGATSDPIPVRRVDEVWRSSPYGPAGQQRSVVVWRLGQGT
jgi:hypothetical protein